MDDKQLESLVVQQVRNVLQNNKPLGSYNILGILTHMGQGIDELFNSLACISCHQAELQTQSLRYPEPTPQ